MLPRVQQKVLAMFFFENLPLADIAVYLGLSKMTTCQMLAETIALLQRSFLEITSPKSVTEAGKLLPPEQRSDTGSDRAAAGLAAAAPLANSIPKTDLPDRRRVKMLPLHRAETALVLGALGIIYIVFLNWAHNSLLDPTELALRQAVPGLAHSEIRRQNEGPPLDSSRTDHLLTTSFPQAAVLQPSRAPASSPSPAGVLNHQINPTAPLAPRQGSVISGLPGATLSGIERQYSRQTALGESAASRQLNSKREARKKLFIAHIALVDGRMNWGPSGKKDLMNMWKRHLEGNRTSRQTDFAQNLRRRKAIDRRRERHGERSSLFSAIGNALGLSKVIKNGGPLPKKD